MRYRGEVTRFLATVGLFLLPLLGAAAWLLGGPHDKRFASSYLDHSCGSRASQIYRRIQAPEPVDVALLGTSRSIAGIQPRRVEARLLELGRPDLRVENLAYCQDGRNLHYVLLKDLLAAKSVRDVVVEVPIRESRKSHWAFAYLADSRDLLRPPLNPYVLRDLTNGLTVRFERLRQPLIYPGARPRTPEAVPTRILRDPGALARGGAARRRRAAETWRSWARRIGLARHYIEGIAELAGTNGTRLHFLYLPSYGDPWGEMESRELYERYGEVVLPPAEIFEPAASWLDPNHIDEEASLLLSAWLAEAIASWYEPA